MAVNKVVNKSTKTHGAMRNVIEYVLRDDKVREGYVAITGPYAPDKITWDGVYQAFMFEKLLWGKDSGRMYAHNIISFHKDEAVTPEQCLNIGQNFCDRFFPGHQSLIGVHQDRDHLHIHIITNSVSYEDGRKLHQTKKDLEAQKQYTNNLCKELGLSVTEKGKHFDGTSIDEGEITAWNKDKYNLLKHENKKSFLVECAIAIMDTIKNCFTKDMFISGMNDKGWKVNWEDRRKHITFTNGNGNKVRDSNISKTFSMDVSKEGLLNEFKRQNEVRQQTDGINSTLTKYYTEVESAIAGIDNAKTIRNDTNASNRTGRGDGEQQEEDTRLILRASQFNRRNQESKQAKSEAKRDDSIAKRSDRDDERERQRLQAEQILREEAERAAREAEEREKAAERKRSRTRSQGWER